MAIFRALAVAVTAACAAVVSTQAQFAVRDTSGTCRNNNAPYSMSAFAPFDTQGTYASYYLMYNTAGSGVTWQTERNPNVATSLHFNRIEGTVNLPFTTGNYIANYTDMGPATREYNTGAWSDYIFTDWSYRIVAPCTGAYQFLFQGDDGVELYIENTLVNYTTTGTKQSWSAHASTTYTTVPLNLTENTVYRMRFIHYEHTGYAGANVQWKLPGETTFNLIQPRFMIPFQAPRVYLSSGSTLSFRSTTGTEVMEVRLSDPPRGTVTVAIDNAAGLGLFGFDKCTLTFTPANWFVPQRIYVAPIPGVKALPTTKVVPVAFNAQSTSLRDTFASGLLQVVYETGANTGGRNTIMCKGWGDPHYTTWDGQSFNFQRQGTFYLARSLDGTFAVMTVLRRCDPLNPSGVACTQLVYVKYRSAFYQISMNTAQTDQGYGDSTLYVAKLAGAETGVILSRTAPDEVQFDMLLDGVTVKIQVGFFKTWLQKKDWWRYFNVYVYTNEFNKNKLTGVCGNFNGNAADDVTNSDTLVSSWAVPASVNMLDGTGVSVISSSAKLGYTPGGTGGSFSFVYSTDKKLTSFDPICSGSDAPSTPTIPTETVPLLAAGVPIPVLNTTGYTNNPLAPIAANFPRINAFCQPCVPVNQSNPAYGLLVASAQSHAFLDLVNGMNFVDAEPPAAAVAPLLEPFQDQCKVIQANDMVLQCRCTGSQVCVMGVCQNTEAACGGQCLGASSYCNGTTCVCETGRTGSSCEIVIAFKSLTAAPRCGLYGVPINILDDYGSGSPTTDTTPDACLCHSQYGGPTCSDLTTALNCNNSITEANTTYTGQQVIRGSTKGGVINPLDESVEFTIDSPQMATRKFIGFQWGDCQNSANLSNWALTKYQHTTVRSSCNDTFSFGYRVADLVSECGLDIAYMDYNNGEPVPSSAWVRYRGDHHIYYQETIPVAFSNGAKYNLTRTGRLTTPIDAYIQRLYSANTTLNVTSNVTVYSPFTLKAAITKTTIKATATTALVTLTMAINNPYEITCISNRQSAGSAGTFTAGLTVVPNDVSAYFINNDDQPILAEQVCQQDNAGLSPCTASDYDTNKFCWKTVNFMILTNGVCSLGHTFDIDQITIMCNSRYSGADCPLQAPDSSSNMQFTIIADNFCDGQRAIVINDAIVLKSYIPQASRSRTDANNALQTATLGQDIYLTLFVDTLRSLRVFKMTVLPDNAGGFQTKTDSRDFTTPNAATQYIANVNNNLNGDGFDFTTQTHSMKVTLNCDFVQDGALGDATRNCLVTPAINLTKLSTKLTFYVDYEKQRRRRRQATPSDRGYASMTADVSIESESPVAGTPSAAAAPLNACSLPLAFLTLASVLLLAF